MRQCLTQLLTLLNPRPLSSVLLSLLLSFLFTLRPGSARGGSRRVGQMAPNTMQTFGYKI